jgi:hypothetical protein
MTARARLMASLLALVALAALVTQYVVTFRMTGGPVVTRWIILGYFTVLTNGIVLATFARIAATGRMPSDRWLAGVTLWITIVGVVYHLLLATLWAPQGLALWADQGLHTATPLLTILFWVLFAPKAALDWSDAVRWIGWPLIYTIYALIRGMFTGAYPYPFIDLAVLSPGQVAVNSLGLSAAFLAGGLILVALSKVLP